MEASPGRSSCDYSGPLRNRFAAEEAISCPQANPDVTATAAFAPEPGGTTSKPTHAQLATAWTRNSERQVESSPPSTRNTAAISLDGHTTLYMRPLRHHTDSFASLRRIRDMEERFSVVQCVPGRGMTSPSSSATTSSIASLGAPVSTISVANRSTASNASASVACTLCTVACRPLSGPHGCITRKVRCNVTTVSRGFVTAFSWVQTCPQRRQA